MKRVRATVVGAGIAGATVALALAEIGADVEVFESGERGSEHGGWVTLGPAANTALDRVGVGGGVRSIGFPVVRVHSFDTTAGTKSEFSRYEPTHRWPSTHIWRRDLLSVLRDQLDTVGITCHYGTEAATRPESDLVVGADGAYSKLRARLGNSSQPTCTGQTIVYGHHPSAVGDLPANVLNFWTHHHGVTGYVGDHRDGSFWFSRYQLDQPTPAVPAHMMLDPLRNGPIAEILHTSELSSPIALYELAPEGPWHTTDTVIIGDAAHALSPAAGRGATSAIEDAIILAGSVRREDSIPAALARYTALRRPAARATFRPTPEHPVPRIPADQLTLH